MAAEPPIPPPPPPPPPPINDNNSSSPNISNGSPSPETQTGVVTATTSGNDTKIWQRAWSVDEMRKGASTWSLASDAGLLFFLQEFSHNMISQTHSMEQKVDGLVHETKGISAKVHNTFNNFLMLSNTQFIENRVYDEEETKDDEIKSDETNAQEKEKTREELESEVIPKINKAILSGLAVLDSAFVTVEITPEQMSDEEDDGHLPENFRPEPILELTDVYAHRKLPCYIGTQEFQQDDLVGLAESSSEDEEASDNDEKSEENKSSEDEATSESEEETVGSSSEELTATESKGSDESSASSESDEEVVQKKKPRKETEVKDDSDDGLFASGGTNETAKRNQIEDSDEDSENESNEQEKKVAGPPKLDFSSELAAKIGAKMPKPRDSEDDDQDLEESGRHDDDDDDEADKDHLFSASIDTTSSIRSKESKKKKKKKHKKSKSRSSSYASHESGSVVGGVIPHPSGDEQASEKGDDQEDLFTASVDTTASTASKASRRKHKKKNVRTGSQLSNASSSKSEKTHKQKVSPKEDTNLFGASPEGDLFDEDTSSPFSKKGRMFSSGGLFDDDVSDEHDGLSKSPDVDKRPPHVSEDHDENEDIIKPKPKISSTGKKLPAGAVSIFGDQGPFGHMPVDVAEHIAEKSHVTPHKKSSKTETGGGGLFSDDGDDMFTASQSSVTESKTPVRTTKSSKSVDLFDDDNDDEGDDDESLFGVKPAKKEEPQKKKRIPAGAVSIFGASPPSLFNTSTEEEQPTQSVAKASTTASSEAGSVPDGKQSSLFDEVDRGTDNSKTSVAAAVPPIPTKPKRKSNQISLFDDQGDEEDGDDLFASIAPSKPSSKTSKPEQPKEVKKNEVSKPSAKKSTISLFDDDDDDDDEEIGGSGIFASKQPTSLQKPEKQPSSETKPSSKQITPIPGLFGDDEGGLFSETKQNKENTASSVKAVVTPNEKPSQKKSSILPSDDDLFADTRPTQPSLAPVSSKEAMKDKPSVKPSKKTSGILGSDDDLFSETRSTPSDPLLDSVSSLSKADGDEPSKSLPEEDLDTVDGGGGMVNVPAKPTKKIPGAVSLFGGVDIFAGQKPTKTKQSDTDLFGDNEGDLFGVTKPSKPAPVVAPRSKPPKKTVEVPDAHLSQQDKPVQPVLPVPVAVAGQNSMVGKLQKTLAFNPAAMLPGAVRPPSKKQEDVTEATFDKPPSSKTLGNTGKDRARVRVKRRPPTRQARREAATESMDDKSLFGTYISPTTSSNERLSQVDGKPTAALFSDSDDLFSSNSFSASDISDTVGVSQKPSKTKVLETDPLLVSFEDSVDGISPKSQHSHLNVASKKDDITSRSKPVSKAKSDTLFDVESTEDLFSVGSNIKQSSKQDMAEDDEDEDDFLKSDDRPLFSPPPLDFDSEASGDFTKPKTSDDKLLETDTFATLPKKNVKEDDIFPTLPTTKQAAKRDPDMFAASKNDTKDGLFAPGPSTTKTTEPNADIFATSKKEANEKDIFATEPPSRQTAAPEIAIFAGSKTSQKEKEDLFSKETTTAKAADQDIFAPLPSANKTDNKENEDLFAAEPTTPKAMKSEPDIFASTKTDEKEKDLFATLPSASKPDIEDDIFATFPTSSKTSETGAEKKKDKKIDDQAGKTEKEKEKTSKTVVDDIFGDTGSIFDDLPKKSKEKKKKKATTTKEGNIFDDKKDLSGDQDVSTSKTTKKTKGKKKATKSKISIFDDDSPSIFDDPLNATPK